MRVNDDIASIGASATVCCNPTLVHDTSALTTFDIKPKGLRKRKSSVLGNGKWPKRYLVSALPCF
jgi:hypothetical protein